MPPLNVPASAPSRLGWRPGLGTAASLLVSGMVMLWLVSPGLWNQMGNDSRVFYGAATVAAGGGNPYDQSRVIAAQLQANADAAARGSGRTHFIPDRYEYPPIMTALWRLTLPLGDAWFLAINAVLFLAAGVIAMELVLAALGWRDRWWPRLFFVTSVATMTVVYSGNPATFVMLAWSAALLAAIRGRPVLAGTLLAAGLLKPPVGIPAAAAILIALPDGRARMLMGTALGAMVFTAVNVVVAGPQAMLDWVGSLFAFTATINVHQSEVARQCCLAGLSSPFLGFGPIPAMVIAAVLIGGPVLWLYRTGALTESARRQPLLLLALLVTAFLGVTPYVHSTDLGLEALAVLMIAGMPLSLLNRATLVAWALSLPANLLAAAAIAAATGDANKPWGYGVVLTAFTLASLVVAISRYRPAARVAPEPAIA